MLISQANRVVTLIQNVMIGCRPLQSHDVSSGMKFKIPMTILLIKMIEKETLSIYLTFPFVVESV